MYIYIHGKYTFRHGLWMAYSHYHLPFQVVPSMVSQTRRCATGNDAAVSIVAVRNVAWCRVEGPGEFRPISWDRKALWPRLHGYPLITGASTRDWPWMVCNWDISLDRSLLS